MSWGNWRGKNGFLWASSRGLLYLQLYEPSEHPTGNRSEQRLIDMAPVRIHIEQAEVATFASVFLVDQFCSFDLQ